MHSQGNPEYIPADGTRRLFAQVLPARQDSGTLVVFESGGASTRSIWAPVQAQTAAFARAVVYDRAGLGHSDPDPHGRTLARMAADLNRLLDYFAAPRCILVGHSAGGAIVRLAAAERPERIAGLVLADPADEADDTLFPPPSAAPSASASPPTACLPMPACCRCSTAALPADAAADLRRDSMTPAVFRTCAEQSRTFLDELYA